MGAGALHAYQKRNLLVRAALLSEGFSLSESIKSRVSDHYVEHGVMPHDNADAGLPPAKSIFGTSVRRVAVNRSGVIMVDFAESIGEYSMHFTPTVNPVTGLIGWRCSSDSIDVKVLDLLKPKCEPTTATNEGQLLHAIANQNESEVARLIASGANPDAVVNGNTPLMLASKIGHHSIAKLLIDAGASVDNNALNSERRTPLMVAISSDNAQIASLLLSKGASVTRRDYKGLTAQDHAVNTDQRLGGERYLLMVMARLNPNFAGSRKQIGQERSKAAQSAHLRKVYVELLGAANNCHVQRLSSILREEQDLNQPEMVAGALLTTHISKPQCVDTLNTFIKTKRTYQTALLERFSAAAQTCNKPMAQNLMRDNPQLDVLDQNASGITHLFAVIQAGCASMVSMFVRDTDLGDRLPESILFDAMENAPAHSQVELVGALIEAGANVNAKANAKQTSLGTAIALEQPVVAKYLIDAGADVNTATLNHSFPLIEASKKGYNHLVSQLIRQGADLNQRDSLNRTALLAAVAKEQPRLVDTLLRAGANPLLKDNNGINAVMLAETKNLKKIHTLLTSNASADNY